MQLSEQQINLLRELLGYIEFDLTGPTEEKVHKALEALDGLRAQAEARPVAWVDPLDLEENREQFMACSAQHEHLNSNLRFKVPLFTHPAPAAAQAGLSEAKRVGLIVPKDLNDDEAQHYANGWNKCREDIFAALSRAPATPQSEQPFRSAVEAMVRMLEEGEWAEHVAATTGKGDPLAQRLETAITNLINETHEDSE